MTKSRQTSDMANIGRTGGRLRRMKNTETAQAKPASTSRTVTVKSIGLTWLRRNVLLKWPVSQSRLPFQSKTLSRPDWIMQTAKKAQTKTRESTRASINLKGRVLRG